MTNATTENKSDTDAQRRIAPVVMHIDMRQATVERREVREGSMMHFESRFGRVNPCGTVEWSEWLRISTITNYGEVFDPKPKSWLKKLFGA